MASLVADYGSESESDSEENLDINQPLNDNSTTLALTSGTSEKTQVSGFFSEGANDVQSSDDEDTESATDNKISKSSENKLLNPLAGEKLPSASTLLSDGQNKSLQYSIYSNPFEEALKAKNSILEKHVKLSDNQPQKMEPKKSKKSQYKRVCKMFLKGECNFGDKCKFYHDTVTEDMVSPDGSSAVIGAPTPAQQQVFQHFKQIKNYRKEINREQNNEEDDDSFMGNAKRKKRVGVGNGLAPPKKAMTELQRQREYERPWTMN